MKINETAFINFICQYNRLIFIPVT